MAPTPSIDLIENTDEIWVFIDLPGFKPEEIQLEGDPRTLHVSATRPSEIEDGRNVLINERTVQIDRVIQFPTDVEMDEIDAVFDDGVCKITVPKAASERYREIDIRSP
ncbi:Hsp20/alpha crystallin family protein [Halobellus salinisoli]|uniref:Hsp20/alpha crystallin family protein n=1 Tax=Halobellus salinisoli TaxID=3108500 RepID=UPI003009B9E5